MGTSKHHCELVIILQLVVIFKKNWTSTEPKPLGFIDVNN